MSDQPTDSRPSGKRALTTFHVIRGIGIGSAALFIVTGLSELIVKAAESGSIDAADLTIVGVCFACGAVSAGLLFAFAAALRALRGIHAALIRLEQFQATTRTAPTSPAEPTPSFGDATLPIKDAVTSELGAGSPPWQELVMLLQDIRDNSLLSEDERREKKLRSAETEFFQARALVNSLIQQGDFVRARQAAEHLRVRHPEDTRAPALAEQIESAREKYETTDVHAITKQVEDLMSISAWQRALELVQQLQLRHPDSTEAKQLMLRIEREHATFQDEQRRRMQLEVQRFVSRRRWEEALAAARTFIERFPGCAESEALLLEIPTLENNAEIEHRQDLEAQIMDYAKHGRYIEAVELARRVIRDYPGSPQAQALRMQLGRLEELATNPSAPPARLRLD